MLRHRLAKVVAMLALIGMTPMLGSCVEDVGLINRTNPNKIDKTMLEGVWIYAVTTVDAPYSSAVSFTGHTNFGAGAKVIFDVQENFLYARPVVETVEGTESDWRLTEIRKYWDKDARDEFVEVYVGNPIAIWRIQSHFDLVRNYNTFNGAQSNELTENTLDRPWYERDYIRVDWASQQVGNFFHSLSGGVGGASYYVGEDKAVDPDGMTLDAEGGYFDYTMRTTAFSAGQWFCNIYGLSQYDCAPAEMRSRHSFRRLDPKRDYEPIRYHNREQQDLFGYFLTERKAYDLDWGPTIDGTVSFANRWNLWLNTYDFRKPVDDAGEEVTEPCFTDRDCARSDGYRCQKFSSWFEEGYCAKPVARPYTERGLRPIIYHYNQDWHPDYIGEAYEAADEWSDVFKDSIAWAYFYEQQGQGYTRGCDSHADCAVDTLLADVDVTVRHGAVPCHVDGDCGTASCVEGFCATARSCSADAPCALGQTCDGGVCTEGGETVMEMVGSGGNRFSTVVYLGDSDPIVTDDTFSQALRQQASSQGGAWVRFVNAAPEAGSFGMQLGTATVPGGEYDAALDYDPADPATADFMMLAPEGLAVPLRVVEGGATVVERPVDIRAGFSYLAIYNGEDIIFVGADLISAANRGIRFVHAASGEADIDCGIEGVLVDEDISYRTATGYDYIAGNTQRATVTRAGTRGDITCYQVETIGRCVGWGADVSEDDLAEVQVIKDSLPEMFVICENQYDPIAAEVSVADEDFRSTWNDSRYTYSRDGELYNPCGDEALIPDPEEMKRIGDIRYNFFYWINEAQRSGPLGYGPSIADPDTGQLIVGNAYIYGGSMHTYGQYAADIIDLVNGDLATEDVIIGEHVREYLAQKASEQVDPDLATYTAGVAAEMGIGKDGTLPADVFDGPELHAYLQSQKPFANDGTAVDTLVKPVREYHTPELMDYMAFPDKLREDAEDLMPAISSTYYHDRLGKIRGTKVEQLMMNSEVKLAAPHLDPTGEMTPAELQEQMSPANWATKHALRTEEQRMQLLAQHNMYMGEFVDDSIYGLAKEMASSGLWGKAMRLEVARRILGQVLEHEIGHTVGLRHNFSGSTDVFNFFDEWYDIREKERVLCQTDDWCDEVSREACAIATCAADGDCLVGLLCINGQCSGPSGDGTNELVPTGVCSKPIADAVCQNDAACGDGEVCHLNTCHAASLQYVPRTFLTDNEKAQKRTEYQYTTVMDYGGRFNLGIHGLGKYDYAAVRYGYVQLVDTYFDPEPLRQRTEDAAQLFGQNAQYWSFYMNTRGWPTRGTGFFHAFQYLTHYIGVDNNLARVPRPYDQVKYQRDMVVNDTRRYSDLAYLQVPYGFCSDEFRGNMGCYYFDQGIDVGEMAAHAGEQLEQYYIFDAFRRERLYYGQFGNPFGYYARIMDRYLRVLGDAGMFAAWFDNFLFRYGWYQSWLDSPLGGRTFRRAATETFGLLKDVVSSPAPGAYVFDDLTGAYEHASFEPAAEGADAINIPFGIGRYPYTQFGDSLGYTYAWNPLWFGSFWEKLGALVTLTDSTAYFIDQYVGEQLNIGVGTSLGYNTLFAQDMGNFLGGLIAGNKDLYAGRMIQGQYYGPSVPDPGGSTVPVAPGLDTFTLKLYSAVYGLANLPAGFDPSFIDRLAVFVDGEASHFDHVTTGVEPKFFVDPIGGKTYRAYTTNYGQFGDEHIDVGADLIDRANTLAAAWDEATGEEREVLEQRLHEVREILDVLRNLHQIYGTSVLGF